MPSLSDMDKKQPYPSNYEHPHPLPQPPYNPETIYPSLPLPTIPSPSIGDKRPTTTTDIPLTAPSPFGPSFVSTSSGVARVPSSSSSSSASSSLTKAEEKAIKKDRKEQEKIAKCLHKDAEKERRAQEKLVKQQSKSLKREIKHEAKEIKHQVKELKRELSHQTKEAVRLAKNELTIAKNELASINGRGSGSCDRSGCGSPGCSTRSRPSPPHQQPQMHAPHAASPSSSSPPVGAAVYQACPPVHSPQQLALQHEQAMVQYNCNKKLYREQHRMDRHQRRQEHRQNRRLEREIRREQRHHHLPFPFGLVTLGPRIVSGIVGGVASRINHAVSGPCCPNEYSENTNTILVAPAPLPQGSVYPPQGPVTPPQQRYSPPAHAPPAEPMPQPSINNEKKSIGPQDPLLVYSMSSLSISQPVSSSSVAPSAPSAPLMPASPTGHIGEDEDTSAPPSYEMATSSHQ
ncbi:hypothetical protein BGX21_009790 [Mortierella sp. AD011]|nr:hypothetical protein BGX20_007653 [Mortierella sp. AD010]KAF9395757.1 hypothetical protein BGX21_009790 [Mortierella sp. AD011]